MKPPKPSITHAKRAMRALRNLFPAATLTAGQAEALDVLSAYAAYGINRRVIAVNSGRRGGRKVTEVKIEAIKRKAAAARAPESTASSHVLYKRAREAERGGNAAEAARLRQLARGRR